MYIIIIIMANSLLGVYTYLWDKIIINNFYYWVNLITIQYHNFYTQEAISITTGNSFTWGL